MKYGQALHVKTGFRGSCRGSLCRRPGRPRPTRPCCRRGSAAGRRRPSTSRSTSLSLWTCPWGHTRTGPLQSGHEEGRARMSGPPGSLSSKMPDSRNVTSSIPGMNRAPESPRAVTSFSDRSPGRPRTSAMKGDRSRRAPPESKIRNLDTLESKKANPKSSRMVMGWPRKRRRDSPRGVCPSLGL